MSMICSPRSLPEFASQSPFSGRVVGKDKVAWGFKMLDKAFPDLQEELVSITVEDDEWCAKS